jgi:hypothetical protein
MGYGFGKRAGRSARSARVKFLLFTLALALNPLASAKIRYVLDIDGTLVQDQGPTAGWVSYWTLKRIDQRHTSLQPVPESDPQSNPFVDISFGDYRRFLYELGKDEGMLGGFEPRNLSFDPVYPDRNLRFVPGFYRVSNDLTYRRYRPNYEGGLSYLLEDFHDAKLRQQLSRGKLKWQGPAFPLLVAGLSDPAEVDSVVFSTARYQTEEEIFAWLEEMKTDGLVKNVRGKNAAGEPIRPRHHPLHGPDAILFGQKLLEKKIQVPADEATQLLNGISLPHSELVPDEYGARAGQTALYHTVITAEDDPMFVRAISRKLEGLSSDLHFSHRIKFVLFNVGGTERGTEPNSYRWPWRWTVYDRGFGREALPEEIKLWTKKKSDRACIQILRG